MDGFLQVVHFPVPEWIKTYWTYPLVQKAKDELTYQVCITHACMSCMGGSHCRPVRGLNHTAINE